MWTLALLNSTKCLFFCILIEMLTKWRWTSLSHHSFTKKLQHLENGNISNHVMNTNGTVSLKLSTKLMLNFITSVFLLQLFISISHQFHQLTVFLYCTKYHLKKKSFYSQYCSFSLPFIKNMTNRNTKKSVEFVNQQNEKTIASAPI